MPTKMSVVKLVVHILPPILLKQLLFLAGFFVCVKTFKTLSSLVALVERECTDEEIKTCLADSLEARHLHYVTEPENIYVFFKTSLLISRCTAYKSGKFLFCSVLCNIFEHD